MGRQAIHVPSSLPAATAEPETQIKEFPSGSSFLELGPEPLNKRSRHPRLLLLFPGASWEMEAMLARVHKGGSISWLRGPVLGPRPWAQPELLNCRVNALFRTIANHFLLLGIGHLCWSLMLRRVGQRQLESGRDSNPRGSETVSPILSFSFALSLFLQTQPGGVSGQVTGILSRPVREWKAEGSRPVQGGRSESGLGQQRRHSEAGHVA